MRSVPRSLRAARSLRPGLKVLFLTGYAYDAALDKEVLSPTQHFSI